jgi:hypothetical protein
MRTFTVSNSLTPSARGADFERSAEGGVTNEEGTLEGDVGRHS